MAGHPNQSLLQFLNQMLNQVEAESNSPDIELREKIRALELEINKVPSVSSQPPDELEIAKKLDEMSAKLDTLEDLLASSSSENVQAQNILGRNADLWMPAIIATAEERKNSPVNNPSMQNGSAK